MKGTELKKLAKYLELHYPARHWNHLRVWTKFWTLCDELGKS